MSELGVEGRTLEGPVEETRRVLGRAAEESVPLRAIGGIAVWLRCPSIRSIEPPREFRDIDLVGRRRDVKAVSALLESEGYEPAWRFNRLAGGERLLFHDRRDRRKVDVFLDRLEMCHTLTFRDRVDLEPETLPLADLLLSKLQIVRLTDRDVRDVMALLADHDLSEGGADPERLDLGRLGEVCGDDWGWWRTVTGSLETLVGRWTDAPAAAGPDPAVASGRAGELVAFLHQAPKGRRWKLRAVVGERMRWYREPEELRD
ncbi:MAG: hypothetical protein HY658_03850 [Actinobacteria bacterium]|nr:hypothetical protein [Actinomycetota bacterium]